MTVSWVIEFCYCRVLRRPVPKSETRRPTKKNIVNQSKYTDYKRTILYSLTRCTESRRSSKRTCLHKSTKTDSTLSLSFLNVPKKSEDEFGSDDCRITCFVRCTDSDVSLSCDVSMYRFPTFPLLHPDNYVSKVVYRTYFWINTYFHYNLNWHVPGPLKLRI